MVVKTRNTSSLIYHLPHTSLLTENHNPNHRGLSVVRCYVYKSIPHGQGADKQLPNCSDMISAVIALFSWLSSQLCFLWSKKNSWDFCTRLYAFFWMVRRGIWNDYFFYIVLWENLSRWLRIVKVCSNKNFYPCLAYIISFCLTNIG